MKSKFQDLSSKKQKFLKKLGSLIVTLQMEKEALDLCAGKEVYHHTLQEADRKLKEVCPSFYKTVEDRLGFVELSETSNNLLFLRKLPPARRLFYLGAIPIYVISWNWPLEDKLLNSNLVTLNRYIWKEELATRDLSHLLSAYTTDYSNQYLLNKEIFARDMDVKLQKQTEAFLINVYKQVQLD